MKPRFLFEKLTVWQEATRLDHEIYRVTRAFPKEEMFAMTSQVRRASIPISSNVAEGSGRNSDKDFAHFLEQAYDSLMEVASLLYLSFDKGYVNEALFDENLECADRLAGRLVALNRSLKVETSRTPFPRKEPRARL